MYFQPVWSVSRVWQPPVSAMPSMPAVIMLHTPKNMFVIHVMDKMNALRTCLPACIIDGWALSLPDCRSKLLDGWTAALTLVDGWMGPSAAPHPLRRRALPVQLRMR